MTDDEGWTNAGLRAAVERDEARDELAAAKAVLADLLSERRGSEITEGRDEQTAIEQIAAKHAEQDRLRAVLAETPENVEALAQWQLRADYPGWEKEGGGWHRTGYAERAMRIDEAGRILAFLRARAGVEP